jgi:hypothetical protein
MVGNDNDYIKTIRVSTECFKNTNTPAPRGNFVTALLKESQGQGDDHLLVIDKQYSSMAARNDLIYFYDLSGASSTTGK